MRIGTWNMAGLWDGRRRAVIESLDVDVWLFTEVSEHTDLPDFHSVWTEGEMAAQRRWAAVFAREHLDALPQPHPATAAACLAGLTLWSSILPWRTCGERPPWIGADHAHRTRATLEALRAAAPARRLVWGGDWNHALEGREYAGSHDGRAALLGAVAHFGLAVPTAELGHRLPGLLSIDHIALPDTWRCTARQIVAEVEGTRLSDHDIYLVEANSSPS
jgi:endonuclease/exonuclease/phosphatase family metal-dependent hydrolase